MARTILGACHDCACRVIRVQTWKQASPTQVWSSPWVPLLTGAGKEMPGQAG